MCVRRRRARLATPCKEGTKSALAVVSFRVRVRVRARLHARPRDGARGAPTQRGGMCACSTSLSGGQQRCCLRCCRCCCWGVAPLPLPRARRLLAVSASTPAAAANDSAAAGDESVAAAPPPPQRTFTESLRATLSRRGRHAGTPHSERTRQILSQAKQGRALSVAQREAISRGMRRHFAERDDDDDDVSQRPGAPAAAGAPSSWSGSSSPVSYDGRRPRAPVSTQAREKRREQMLALWAAPQSRERMLAAIRASQCRRRRRGTAWLGFAEQQQQWSSRPASPAATSTEDTSTLTSEAIFVGQRVRVAAPVVLYNWPGRESFGVEILGMTGHVERVLSEHRPPVERSVVVRFLGSYAAHFAPHELQRDEHARARRSGRRRGSACSAPVYVQEQRGSEALPARKRRA